MRNTVVSRRAAVALTATVLLTAALPGRVWAQQTKQTPPAPTPNTLAVALERLDEATLGGKPLLVVNPAGVFPFAPPPPPGQPFAPPKPLPTPGRRGYSLATLAPRFDRKVVRLNTLSVLAPRTMMVLNAKPDAPDLSANLPPDRALQLLEASLSRDQWQTLGGENGIGAGDLNAEQRALFLSILPNPFRITRGKTLPNGNVQYGGGSREDEDRDLFSAQQRQQVRLRLSRKTQLVYLNANGPGASRSSGEELQPNANGEVVQIMNSPENANESRDAAYGQTILRRLPNRLKPGQLPFDAAAFNTAVPLADAVTVGDLVKRAAKTTNAELYADPRLARLPVWLGGGDNASARTGDVLQALCWAVTGTFRKLGPAYVLTDDVAGLGTRKAALADWNLRAGKAVREQQEVLQKQIRDQNPLPLLGYAPSDPLAADEAMQKRVTDAFVENGPYVGGLEVDAARLPPALTKRLQDAAKYGEQNPQYAVRDDRVKLGAILSKEWIVPGVGPVPDTRFNHAYGGLHELVQMLPLPTGPPPGFAPPAPVPPLALTNLARAGLFATRALVVAPANLDEARQAIAAAKRRGLNQVWLALDENSDPALLPAALAAGKASGVAIAAAVRLLHPPTDANTPGDADVNILGETSTTRAARRDAAGLQNYDVFAVDALRPDRVWLRGDAVPAARQTWLANLAKTPGLAGLAIRDTAPPGYAAALDAKGDAPASDQRDGRDDFGYTPDLRLACLRAHGFDPVDVDWAYTLIGKVELNLPFMDDLSPGGYRRSSNRSTELRRHWNTLRAGVNRRALVPLHAALQKSSASAFPIYLRDRTEPTINQQGGWYGTWNQADKLPAQTPGDPLDDSGASRSLAPAARAVSKRILLNITEIPATRYGPLPAGYKPDEVQDFARLLKYRLEREAPQPWDGLVLDLSEMPVGDALRLLPALAEVAE